MIPMIDNANLKTNLNNGILVAQITSQKVGDFEAMPIRTDIEKVGPQANWKVIIDMTQVIILGSSGIGMLLAVKKLSDAGKGKLVICGISDDLMGVLKISALTKLFTFRKDVKEALAAF